MAEEFSLEDIDDALRAQRCIAHDALDRFLPEGLRAVPAEYWTPLRMAVRAAGRFEELDIRSVVAYGDGKVIAALVGRLQKTNGCGVVHVLPLRTFHGYGMTKMQLPMPNTKTVLVVDDERVLALDLQLTLIQLGYNVPVTVASGDEALQMAEVFPPDVVLVDIWLKGPINGIDTALRLRARFDFALIYIAGTWDADTRHQAVNSSPDAWLQKPLNRGELEATLRRVVAAREARRSARPGQ